VGIMGDKHIIKNIPGDLTWEEKVVVLSLMRNGKITDDKLKEKLNLKSSNAARHHRKKVERKGIIKGYRAEVDMAKLGFPVEFMVIIDIEDSRDRLETLLVHAHIAKMYYEEIGDINILPLHNGLIWFEEIVNVGESFKAIIKAHATDSSTATFFANVYLPRTYPFIKAKILNIHGGTTRRFFIDKKYIEEYISMLPPTDTTKKYLKKYYETVIKAIKDRKG
jgi:DNA-binding Lrp family transcriptional regulator